MNPLANLFKPKVCIRCHKEFKPVVGNQQNCQDCSKQNIKEIKARYRAKNRQTLNQKYKEYYYSHLAEARAQKRRYNNAHPERNEGYKHPEPTPEKWKHITGRTQAKRNARRFGMIKACTETGEHAGRIELHHNDKNPMNNIQENLQYLCKKHHAFLHRKPLSLR